jgi:hypothetical protein
MLPPMGASEIRSMSSGLALGRHETFAPRYGWLKKAVDAATSDPTIFSKDQAPVLLGVGKNMVRAIRYWGIAFKVLEEGPATRGQVTEVRPSTFGASLLGKDGWDPYLEDPASLWLLHWRLLSEPCDATAWSFAFFRFPVLSFSPDQLIDALEGHCRDRWPDARLRKTSIRKDVHCFIRMYLPTNARDWDSEESIPSPFSDLGILATGSTRKAVSFDIGAKASLPAEVILATSLEFAAAKSPTTRTISLRRLMSDIGSPGLAFKLTERTLFEALDHAGRTVPGVALSDAADVTQLVFREDPARLAEVALRRMYDQHWNQVPA